MPANIPAAPPPGPPPSPLPVDGVFGEGTNGVHGRSPVNNGRGVWGEASGSSPGSTGVLGSGNTGVVGIGTIGDGVRGESQHNGVHGQSASASDSGVWGENTGGGYGVAGSSAQGTGVIGLGAGASIAPQGPNGVFGRTTSGSDSGVWGDNTGGGYGVAGSSAQGTGLLGKGVIGIHGTDGRDPSQTDAGAGLFEGNVNIYGNLNIKSQRGVISDVILSDCAEHFDVADTQIDPGTVMVIGQDGTLRPSDEAYDQKAAGVVSGAGNFKPGIILGSHLSSENKGAVIALFGKVYCKVDAQYAPIAIGDLLTTSQTPGHAMKAADPLKAFGAVIGKALLPLQRGQGLIPILIALQ